MEFLRLDLVRYGIAALALLLAISLIRRAYTWYSGLEERRIGEQIREAIESGDLRKAGDLQLKRGLFVEAARIFQRAGEHARAGAVFLRLGEEKKAADEFEKAEEWARAAPLFRKTGELLRAANCYERSDAKADRIAAAECLNSLKEYLRAGRHYQFAEEFELAADCFAKVEDLDALDVALTMLENAALAKQTDPERRKELWRRAAELATKLGAHERAARAFDEAGESRKAARIYEAPLKRYDLAAALYAEAGDAEAEARMTAAAGGEATVATTRLARARARGDTAAVERLGGDDWASGREGPSRQDTPATKVALDRGADRGADKAPGSDKTDATVRFASGDARSDGRGPKHRLDDRFELLGELGRGGMGIVHRAKDLRLNRYVALKFLPPDVEPGSTLHRLFLREARAAAGLTHAGIVTVYDVGTFDDREFIAMELVEGVTLDRVLADEGPLPVADALEMAEKILIAVEHAHQKSVIHRDLKPANMMRTRDGIKVMDFGLAKVVNSPSSGGQTVIGGTPNYMPPEQRTGSADHRADVFSLGVTFYELLTAVLPGHPGEPASLASNYPTPRERVPQIPARLSDLIMRCLEHDRAHRPQDVVSMLAEVREIRVEFLAPAPVRARPQPSPTPMQSLPAKEPSHRKRPAVDVISRAEPDEEAPVRVEHVAAKRAPLPRVAREESDAPPPIDRVERIAPNARPSSGAKAARPGQFVDVVDSNAKRGKDR